MNTNMYDLVNNLLQEVNSYSGIVGLSDGLNDAYDAVQDALNNSVQCEGYTRTGNAFSLGPVSWKRCENVAIVSLTCKQEKVETFPACESCWLEAIENKIRIIETNPLSVDSLTLPTEHACNNCGCDIFTKVSEEQYKCNKCFTVKDILANWDVFYKAIKKDM